MATLLKDLKLTSVDLVRAGANQEADICLYKSADPQAAPEATESPTEAEKNVLKRFIDWLRKNPTEAENEPHSPVEKEDKPATDKIYKSAIIESLASITTDTSLNDDEKLDMVEKSLDQFYKKRKLLWDIDDEENEWDPDLEQEGTGSSQPTHVEEVEEVDKSSNFDEIEEIQKENPYHAADGKFAPRGGGGSGAGGTKVKFSAYSDFPKTVKYDGEEYYNEGERGHMKTRDGGKAQSYVRWDSNNNEQYVSMNDQGKIERD